MSSRVLIAPDKFKGTLTARAAADAIARGWRQARPGDQIELLPMSDGGDGFGEILGSLLGARAQRAVTVDAAHRPCRTRWWWEPRSRTAVIESAEVIGLARNRGFHPYDLDSFGLGALIRAAARKGARHCLIGIGGSATVDGGFGVARALGWKFLDDRARPIVKWTQLDSLATLVPPRNKLPALELIVAVDVSNPLLGSQGCARVYGPQKGLTEFDVADRCLGRLAQIARRQFGRNHANDAGAGAAGGLGFGLRCFADARLQPGFDLVARTAKLEDRLSSADLVITGEGGIDRSTFMGKGVGQIVRTCRQLKIPCIGMAGVITDPVLAGRYFAQSGAMTDLTSSKRAHAEPARWLERLASKIAAGWHDPVSPVKVLPRRRPAG